MKSLSDLRSALEQIKEENLEQDTLLNRIYSRYHEETTTQLDLILNHCIDDPVIIADTLKNFLLVNWNYTRGTALSYTATADKALTELLCELALFVAEQNNQSKSEGEYIGTLSVLMPSVSLEPITLDFPTLMPCEENGYTDIDNPIEILKTHILNDKGNMLIPVKSINQLDETTGLPKIANPYFDTFHEEHTAEMAYVSKSEFERIKEHSKLTRAIFDAKMEFEGLANNTTNLLGQLKKLEVQLHYNSVEVVGAEEACGGGAYLAIYNFMTYLEELSENEKSKIPSGITKEINLLRDFASDKAKIGDIGSCLATRRTRLKSAIKGNEAKLSDIGISGESKTQLIEKAKESLDGAKDELTEALSEKRYDNGIDKLGINKELLNYLDFELSFYTLEDVEQIKRLSLSEIYEFCLDEALAKQIVDKIANIENLVTFIIDMPADKLEMFLSTLKPNLQASIIETGQDFSSLLLTLDDERKQACINADLINAPMLFSSISSLSNCLKFLSPKQRLSIYEKLISELPALLTLPNYQSQFLTTKQQLRLYTQLCEKIPSLPEDPESFNDKVIKFYYTSFVWNGFSTLSYKTYLTPLNSYNDILIHLGLPVLALGVSTLLAIVPIGFSFAAANKLLEFDLEGASNYMFLAGISLALDVLAIGLSLVAAIAALPGLASRVAITGWYSMFGKGESAGVLAPQDEFTKQEDAVPGMVV